MSDLQSMTEAELEGAIDALLTKAARCSGICPRGDPEAEAHAAPRSLDGEAIASWPCPARTEALRKLGVPDPSRTSRLSRRRPRPDLGPS